jgi:indole-3-glycerol phosphate synthase
MTILDTIITTRKERVAVQKQAVPEYVLQRVVGPPRSFFAKNGGVTLIAECKKGSPSHGIFLNEYEPVYIAKQYEAGGADAISVLTEPDYFFGTEQDLIAVRENVTLPVLRKDFIFDTYQVKETWAIGADAMLLIAAALSESQMQELAACAGEYGLEILLEIHNHEELEKSLAIPAAGLGINARNLKDFSIDLEICTTLCNEVPKERVAVAESGLHGPQDGKAMFDAGFRGFLVGEYFITAKERIASVRAFREALR